MVNLAELDTAFLVPCKHCAELLQEGERFCPTCGKDQSDANGAGITRLDAPPERGTSGAGAALAPIAVESTVMPRQEAQEALGHHIPASAAKEEFNSEIGRVRPSTFWQKEVLGGGGPEHWAARSVNPKLLMIGILATLVVLLLFAVVHDHFYLDQQSEPSALPEFRANGRQGQRASSRGDLGAAEGVLEPAAPPAQAPLPPAAPMIAAPAPGIGVADPKEKECNATLAALALCPKR